MTSLHEIFLRNGEKRVHKWIHYFDIYERHFRRYVDKAPTILEIGVSGGGSLQMWKEYFGADAKIVGLDIAAKCKQYEEENIEIFIGSQSDEIVINEIKNKYTFDIVIDDGSHQMADMKSTFDLLYDFIDPRGIYMVEDLQCSYYPRYGGGLGKEGTFIEFVKQSIDELNACHFPAEVARKPTRFTATTASISVYDSVVAFEKAPQGERQAVICTPMAVED